MRYMAAALNTPSPFSSSRAYPCVLAHVRRRKKKIEEKKRKKRRAVGLMHAQGRTRKLSLSQQRRYSYNIRANFRVRQCELNQSTKGKEKKKRKKKRRKRRHVPALPDQSVAILLLFFPSRRRAICAGGKKKKKKKRKKKGMRTRKSVPVRLILFLALAKEVWREQALREEKKKKIKKRKKGSRYWPVSPYAFPH